MSRVLFSRSGELISWCFLTCREMKERRRNRVGQENAEREC